MGTYYVAHVKHDQKTIGKTHPCDTAKDAKLRAEALLESMKKDAKTDEEVQEILKYSIEMVPGWENDGIED